jgi:hypothetical protein
MSLIICAVNFKLSVSDGFRLLFLNKFEQNFDLKPIFVNEWLLTGDFHIESHDKHPAYQPCMYRDQATAT